MENKKNKINKEEETFSYTLSELFDDIQEELTECDEDSHEGEKVRREYMHKLKVFQTILGLKLPDFDFINDNSEEIKAKIEVQVNNDELLFGYTFFLSLNSKFDYSWNYLRKQIERYMNFLYDVYKFISYVISDINLMTSRLDCYKDLHIEFNELFDIHFIHDAPYVKTIINWNNFHQISKVKNGYYVIAKYDETILLTCLRKYNDKPDSFIESVNQVLIAWNKQTDKKDKF